MLIECIPNVSEGQRPDVVAEMAAAIRAVLWRAAARLLIGRVAQPIGVHARRRRRRRSSRRVMALFERAVAAIDLRTHRGEHPRLGAVDVVPFVPIDGRRRWPTASRWPGRSARRWPIAFSVPVYLYEEASTNPARKNLEDIRRGEFEGLAAKMATDRMGARLRPGRAASVGRRVRSSARGCRSSPTTSTSPPTGSTSPRRSPRRSATAAAATVT